MQNYKLQKNENNRTVNNNVSPQKFRGPSFNIDRSNFEIQYQGDFVNHSLISDENQGYNINSQQDNKNKPSNLPQKKKYNNKTNNALISHDLFREKSNSMYSEKIQRQNTSYHKNSLNLIDSQLSQKEQEKIFPKSLLTDSEKNIQNEYNHQESIINDSSANILNQQEKIQELDQNKNNNLSRLNELYNDINFIDSNNQSNNNHQQEPPLQVVRREKYVNTNQELNQHLQAQINTSDCSFSDEEFDNDDDYQKEDNQCEENELGNQQLNFEPQDKFQKQQSNRNKNSNEVCENIKNFTPNNSNIVKERKGKNTFRRNERHNFLFFKVINEVSHSKRQKNRQQKQAQNYDSSKGILVDKGDLHKNSLYAKKKGITNQQPKILGNFFLLNRIKKRFGKILENTEIRRWKLFKQLNLYSVIQDLAYEYQGNNQDLNQRRMKINIIPQEENDSQIEAQNILLKYGLIKKSCLLWLSRQRRLYYAKYQRIKHIFKKSPKIFQPDNKFVYYLNILCSICFIILGFLYSVDICFSFTLVQNDLYHYLKYVCLIIFILGIFTRLNTAIYVKGEVITERKTISKYYKKEGQFYFDLISLTPLIYNIIIQKDSYFQYFIEGLFFFKLFSFYQITMSIERHYYIYGERSYSYTIISLFIKLIGFCHAIALLWNILGEFEIKYLEYQGSWIQTLDLVEANWYHRYIESFYWSAATMMLVGTKGNNQIEVTFTVIIMFLTVGIFGYLIGSINIILEELNKKSKNYKQELEVVNKYLRNKEVSQELQSRVRNYLEYLHRASGDMTASGEVSTVLDKLPKNLSQDIQIEVKSEYLMYFPFIYNHFSDRVLEQLIYEIEERYYVPNEIIFKQGDFEDICIFLVAKGQVKLYKERETISQAQQTNSIYNNQFNYKEGEKQDFGKNILSYNQNQNRGINMQDIQEKEVFGENCFCSGLAYPYTARSSKFSTLYCIKRSSFLKIIERYPFDYEKFCLIKDQIFLNGISKYAKKHCFICKKEHTEKNCNVIHYQPDKLTLIEKYEYSTPQTDRIFKIRPYRKRVRCLEIIEDLYVIKRDIKLDENLRLKIKEIEKIQNDYNQQIFDEYDLEAEQDNYYYDDYNSEESSENDKIEEQDSQFLSYQSESNNNNILLSNDHQSRKSMNTSQGYRRQSLQSQQTFRSKRPSERLASEASENNFQNNSSEFNNTSLLQYNTKASNVLQIQLTKHSNNSRLLENNSVTKMQKLHHRDKNQEDFRNRHENRRSKFTSKNMKDQLEDRQQNYSQQNVKFGDNFNVNRDVMKRIPTNVQTDGQGSNIKYDYGISKSMKSMKSMKSYKSLFSVKSKVRFDQQQNIGNHELQKLKTNMNQKDLNDILFKLFDKQKEYKIYNPQNNLNRVLSKYKGYMRWNLKKQRNKNYKLFTQKYTTFKSLETQVNIRKTVINPNTKKVMKTIIYKKALKLNENQNLQAAHDKFENLQI